MSGLIPVLGRGGGTLGVYVEYSVYTTRDLEAGMCNHHIREHYTRTQNHAKYIYPPRRVLHEIEVCTTFFLRFLDFWELKTHPPEK